MSVSNPQTDPSTSNQWEKPQRHSVGAEYLFCDGHAKYYKQPTIYPISANGQAECAATNTYFKASSGQASYSWSGCN